MISLKKLILENGEDINSDLWDDWIEYIRHNEYTIPKDEIKKLIKKFNLQYELLLKVIVHLYKGNESVYLEYRPDDEAFDYIKDIEQWLYDLDDSRMENLLGYAAEDIYNGHIEGTLKDMKSDAGKVYHYTTEDKWEEIQQSGGMRGSSGTGLTNRYISGIFTSTDPAEHAMGTYGDICLELDLSSFKKANNIPELNLSYEPDIEEYFLRNAVKSQLKLDNIEINMDSSGGMSPHTIIVHHNIPIRFIRQLQ